MANRVLKEAGAAFARSGYRETSLREVADRVGIRVPTLLYHYPSKQALYEAIVRRFHVELEEVVAVALDTEGSAAERLETVIIDLSAFADRHRRLIRVIVTELMAPSSLGLDVVAEVAPRILARVESILRASASPPLPDHAPVRAVLMYIVVGYAYRNAVGDLAKLLFGPDDPTMVIARELFASLYRWPASPRRK